MEMSDSFVATAKRKEERVWKRRVRYPKLRDFKEQEHLGSSQTAVQEKNHVKIRDLKAHSAHTCPRSVGLGDRVPTADTNPGHKAENTREKIYRGSQESFWVLSDFSSKKNVYFWFSKSNFTLTNNFWYLGWPDRPTGSWPRTARRGWMKGIGDPWGDESPNPPPWAYMIRQSDRASLYREKAF